MSDPIAFVRECVVYGVLLGALLQLMKGRG